MGVAREAVSSYLSDAAHMQERHRPRGVLRPVLCIAMLVRDLTDRGSP